MPPTTRCKGLIIASLLLLIAACSSSASREDMNEDTAAALNIHGKWRVEYIQQRPVIDFSPAFIEFDQERVSGNSSCNQFSGQYKQLGNSLSFSPLISTAKMCGPALMDQEDRMNRAINRVTHAQHSTNEGFLLLLDKNNHTLFTLVK
ncbi:MAG: META domain-containing protein [Sinobacterium sp.]|nr:META domain-containing protein [Sinobacterium sp.]